MWFTNENADCLCEVTGIKNGLGHGDDSAIVDVDDVERIVGIRIIFVLDEFVLASRMIGLKNINSVLILSGDEQHSLIGVSRAEDDDDDELLSCVISSSKGFVIFVVVAWVEAEVEEFEFESTESE